MLFCQGALFPVALLYVAGRTPSFTPNSIIQFFEVVKSLRGIGVFTIYPKQILGITVNWCTTSMPDNPIKASRAILTVSQMVNATKWTPTPTLLKESRSINTTLSLTTLLYCPLVAIYDGF